MSLPRSAKRFYLSAHFPLLLAVGVLAACATDVPSEEGDGDGDGSGGAGQVATGGTTTVDPGTMSGGAIGSTGGSAVATGGDTSMGTGGMDSDPPVWTCDECPEPSPTLVDWIGGHGETMTLLDHDGHVAVYVDDDVNTTDAAWVRQFVSDSVAYMKQHYDEECHYGNDRLFVFLHQGNHGGGTISSYFDQFSSYRNAIDGGAGTWVRNFENVNVDILSHELAHIVEGSSNCIHESPGFGVWGDSKWAEIFQYDLYVGLGLTEDADKVYERFSTNGDPWFSEFYFPMYEQYGGVEVLDGFFKLLAEYFPRGEVNDGHNLRYSRRVNMGELVHFYSGAAGADLSELAAEAFDEFEQAEFDQAKVDFPDVTY